MPAAMVTWFLYSSVGVAVLSLAAVVATALVVWGTLTAVAVAVALVLIRVLALDRGDTDDREGGPRSALKPGDVPCAVSQARRSPPRT